MPDIAHPNGQQEVPQFRKAATRGELYPTLLLYPLDGRAFYGPRGNYALMHERKPNDKYKPSSI